MQAKIKVRDYAKKKLKEDLSNAFLKKIEANKQRENNKDR